jgi:hypothetical protein
MKKIIITLVAALAVLAGGVAVATPAQASDYTLTQALKSEGLSAGRANDAQFARGICEYLSVYRTPRDIAKVIRIGVQEGFTYEEAGFLVGASVQHVCPQYRPALMRFINTYA